MSFIKKCDICGSSLGLFSSKFAAKDGFVCDVCYFKSDIRLKRRESSVKEIQDCLLGNEEGKKILRVNEEKSKTVSTSTTKQPTAKSPVSSPSILAADDLDNVTPRFNYWTTFPKKLGNGQTLYKTYVKNPIEPAVSTPTEYNKLSLGEPLKFIVEDATEHTVAIYQGRIKVGYIEKDTSRHMACEYLERGDLVFGFLSHIDPAAGSLKMIIAFYKDSRKEKIYLGLDYSDMIDEIRKKAKIVIDYTHKEDTEPYHTQKISMERGDKTLYLIDKRYGIYIHDSNDSKYDFSALKLGAKVSIQREPSNEVDKKAVVVKQSGKRIGYLYSDMQQLANEFLTSSGEVSGHIVDIEDSGNKIKIYIALLFYR